MEEWTVDEVGDFLQKNGVPEDVIKRFKDNTINGKALVKLDLKKLESLGLKIGPAVILLDVIQPQKRWQILQEKSVEPLNKQQKYLEFKKGESSREACYVSFIASNRKRPKPEETCGVLYLSKEIPTDRKKLWEILKNHQRSVYECLPAVTKKRFSYECNSKEIRNVFDESCGIACSPKPLEFNEVKGSKMFWIFIVDKVLLQDVADTGEITLSLTNSSFECSVKFKKSAVHVTCTNSSSIQFSKPLHMPPSDTGDIPPKVKNIKLQDKPRTFNKSVGNKSYTKGYRLAALETGRKDLIQPAHEFKLFSIAYEDQKRAVGYFVKETLRFACGCLNSRTNGTIHFGIADGDSRNASTRDKSIREIVGVKVKNQDRFVSKLTKSFTSFKENEGIAKQCIRPPAFVPVKNGEDERYVIEVDVEPMHLYTEGKQIIVHLEDTSATAYERDGPNTVVCGNQHANMMKKLDEERRAREISSSNVQNKTPVFRPLLSSTLRKLLCLKEDELRVIVLTELLEPTHEQTCADFLRAINYHSVIDFGHKRGIQKKVCEDTRPENKPHLAEDLQNKNSINYKQAWILANGSSEDEKKTYEDWYVSNRNRYLSEYVKNISTGLPSTHTTVLFLLLSNESYKPMISLFQEFRKQYGGLSQLVYVAENQDTADPWESGLDISMKHLRPSGLVGLSWSEFSEQIKQLTGQSMGSTFLMPNASGVGAPSDRNDFRPDILYPLSLNECEYIGDLTYEERQNKSAEEERKFHSEKSVSWENFWFTDNGFSHVLSRDVLQEALEKTEDLLREDGEEGCVFSLEIKHEAGAGGTTLGKNILWHFASSSKCRCCVVEQITDQTAVSDAILQLWRHDDLKGSKRLPVLALLDDFSKTNEERLESNVTTAAQRYLGTERPVIVFIKTKRNSTLPQKRDYVECQTVLLTRRLSPKEHRWFVHKFKSSSFPMLLPCPNTWLLP